MNSPSPLPELRRQLKEAHELQLAAARELPPEDLPRLMGDLEEVRATVLPRLLAPAAPSPPPEPDELIDIEEASRRLGVSEQHLYKHDYPGITHREPGTDRVRFSKQGIDKYIKDGLPSGRQGGYTSPVAKPRDQEELKGNETKAKKR